MLNITRNFLIMLTNLQQGHLKLSQKEQLNNQQTEPVIRFIIKLLIKSGKFQNFLNKIIKRQLQMSMIKNYLKKDVHLQEKDKNLLMI